MSPFPVVVIVTVSFLPKGRTAVPYQCLVCRNLPKRFPRVDDGRRRKVCHATRGRVHTFVLHFCYFSLVVLLAAALFDDHGVRVENYESSRFLYNTFVCSFLVGSKSGCVDVRLPLRLSSVRVLDDVLSALCMP